jgi:hypothetical protein
MTWVKGCLFFLISESKLVFLLVFFGLRTKGTRSHRTAVAVVRGCRQQPRAYMGTAGLPTVLVTAQAFPETLSILSAAPATIIVNPHTHPFQPSELAHHASKADAVLAFMPDCIGFLEGCPALKVVGCALKVSGV